MSKSNFEWDESKNIENQRKHGVSFNEAQFAFMDEKRVIAEDLIHSQEESRYYCFGLNCYVSLYFRGIVPAYFDRNTPIHSIL